MQRKLKPWQNAAVFKVFYFPPTMMARVIPKNTWIQRNIFDAVQQILQFEHTFLFFN